MPVETARDSGVISAAARPDTLSEFWKLFRDTARFAKNDTHTTEGEDSRAAILIAGIVPCTTLRYIDKNKCDKYEMVRRAGGIRYTVTLTSRTGNILAARERESWPVGSRSVEADMKLLRTLILWPMNEYDDEDEPHLRRDPTVGYAIPQEIHPRQQPADQRRYEATLMAAAQLASEHAETQNGYLYELLGAVLPMLEGSGRRASATLGFEEPDLRLDAANGFRNPMILFRADLDKKGVKAEIPVETSVAKPSMRGCAAPPRRRPQRSCFPAVRRAPRSAAIAWARPSSRPGGGRVSSRSPERSFTPTGASSRRIAQSA